MDAADSAAALAALVARSERMVVITGAGCSTDSGIPDYRDADGEWKRNPPMRFQQFLRSAANRKRYWARSMAGWNLVARAEPNDAHRALSRLEDMGKLHLLITQNVDGLHQKAGSRNVIDLHGRIDQVRCLGCDRSLARHVFQDALRAANPQWQAFQVGYAPDGDADLEAESFEDFRLPDCASCGGDLKPDVVFFGESVPKPRVARAMAGLADADALVVVGSSLMVWSGYRFVKAAQKRGIPVAALTLGKTRADEELTMKVVAPCGPTLARLVENAA